MLFSNFFCVLGAVSLLFFGTCNETRAATYPLGGSVVGQITSYATQSDDNLYAIARQFDLGIVEVLAANPDIDPWLPPEGTKLTLPTVHVLPIPNPRGIVINLSELRLYYFPDTRTVMTFPIGIGREGWQTPVGKTSVVGKRKNPTWIPPASIRRANPDLPEMIPPGPDNPLGDYALDLAWKEYRIHGTNLPSGVGKRVSHGCIRLYPEDIAALFQLIEKGTPVTIIDRNYSLGWQGEKLWMEVTPTQQQTDRIADYEQPPPIDIPDVYRVIEQTVTPTTKIDWYAVEEAIRDRNGVPVPITQN